MIYYLDINTLVDRYPYQNLFSSMIAKFKMKAIHLEIEKW